MYTGHVNGYMYIGHVNGYMYTGHVHGYMYIGHVNGYMYTGHMNGTESVCSSAILCAPCHSSSFQIKFWLLDCMRHTNSVRFMQAVDLQPVIM